MDAAIVPLAASGGPSVLLRSELGELVHTPACKHFALGVAQLLHTTIDLRHYLALKKTFAEPVRLIVAEKRPLEWEFAIAKTGGL